MRFTTSLKLPSWKFCFKILFRNKRYRLQSGLTLPKTIDMVFLLTNLIRIPFSSQIRLTSSIVLGPYGTSVSNAGQALGLRHEVRGRVSQTDIWVSVFHRRKSLGGQRATHVRNGKTGILLGKAGWWGRRGEVRSQRPEPIGPRWTRVCSFSEMESRGVPGFGWHFPGTLLAGLWEEVVGQHGLKRGTIQTVCAGPAGVLWLRPRCGGNGRNGDIPGGPCG